MVNTIKQSDDRMVVALRRHAALRLLVLIVGMAVAIVQLFYTIGCWRIGDYEGMTIGVVTVVAGVGAIAVAVLTELAR